MRDFIKKYKIEIIIFVCALLVRLALFSINFTNNSYDLIPTIKGDDGYYELSQNLIKGNGFSYEVEPPYTPNPLRPPVWPFTIAFLVNFFGTYWAVLVFEVLIGSLIPVLSVFLAKRFLDYKYAKWVGFFLVIEPFSVLLSTIMYTETMFTFLFLVALIFLFRYVDSQTYRNIIWMSVFFSLATLVKPTIQYFPIIIPIILFYIFRKSFRKEILIHSLVFILISATFFTPWFYRNKVEFGVWGMSAQPAFNLYVYLTPSVLAINNKTSFAEELQNFVKKDNFDEGVINLSNAEFYTQKSLDVIMEHKPALVKSILITIVTFFTHDGILTVFGYSGLHLQNLISKPLVMLLSSPQELISSIITYAKSPLLFAMFFRLFWILSSILFVLGSFFAIKSEKTRPFAIIAIVIILYFAFTTSINGLGVNARFRFPVNSLILSLATVGLFAINDRISRLYKKF